ncbi:hypothetical protein M011DRAFT_433404 [Sporormia fimetaria CBS 119925]|uniref:Uncharacterized protein n=1 Tax=Sporormia fimetaria CBS 119925 TaxID=1340428 RepID=A0A6A6UVG2_9PLEO|nr:hypothetical protein M011DRAFT_433404 [Sporormia fimetaria CBS 119925]
MRELWYDRAAKAHRFSSWTAGCEPEYLPKLVFIHMACSGWVTVSIVFRENLQ